MRRERADIICSLILLGALAASGQARAQAGDKQTLERRAEEARKACQTGKVDEGIALLADLYVTTRQAYWLYNEGRCYEENRRFAEAAARFKDYLREAPDLSPGEVAKVNARIEQAERADAAAKPVPAAVTLPPALQVRSEPAGPPVIAVQADVARAPVPERVPLYRRRWFLLSAAGVLTAALVTGVLLATRDPLRAPLCPMSECDIVTGVPTR